MSFIAKNNSTMKKLPCRTWFSFSLGTEDIDYIDDMMIWLCILCKMNEPTFVPWCESIFKSYEEYVKGSKYLMVSYFISIFLWGQRGHACALINIWVSRKVTLKTNLFFSI